MILTFRPIKVWPAAGFFAGSAAESVKRLAEALGKIPQGEPE